MGQYVCGFGVWCFVTGRCAWALLEELRKHVLLPLGSVDLEMHVPACEVFIYVCNPYGDVGCGGHPSCFLIDWLLELVRFDCCQLYCAYDV